MIIIEDRTATVKKAAVKFSQVQVSTLKPETTSDSAFQQTLKINWCVTLCIHLYTVALKGECLHYVKLC